MEPLIYIAFVLAAFIIVAWTLDYDDEQEELSNPYLTTVIKLTKLIEEARPELKGLAMDNQLVAARRANLEKKEELLSGEDHYMKPFLWDGRPLDE